MCVRAQKFGGVSESTELGKWTDREGSKIGKTLLLLKCFDCPTFGSLQLMQGLSENRVQQEVVRCVDGWVLGDAWWAHKQA